MWPGHIYSPLDITVGQMAWEQEVGVVVMLTGLVEGFRVSIGAVFASFLLLSFVIIVLMGRCISTLTTLYTSLSSLFLLFLLPFLHLIIIPLPITCVCLVSGCGHYSGCVHFSGEVLSVLA